MYTRFLDIAPWLASVPEARVLREFAVVEASLNGPAFGSQFNEAVIQLSAHNLTLLANVAASGGMAPAGPLASVSTGGLSVSYAGSSIGGPGDSDLYTTVPGRAFARIRDSLAASGMSWV